MKKGLPGWPQKGGAGLWSCDFILVLFVSFLSNTADFSLVTTLPLLFRLLGGNPFTVGLAATLFSLSALLTRPLWGGLSDRIGRRAVLLMGSVLNVMVALFYLLNPGLAVFVFFRLVSGIGFSAITTSAHAAAADLLPATRLTEGLGYYAASDTVATAAGPFVSLLLYNRSGYQPVLFFVLALNLLNLLCALSVRYEKSEPSGRDERTRRLDLIRQTGASGFAKRLPLIERSALKPSLTILLVCVSNSSVVHFLILYGLEREIALIGSYFTVLAVSIAVSRLLVGRAVARLGKSFILLSGLSLHLVSFLLMAFSSRLAPVLVAAALSGLGGGVVAPITGSMVVDRSHEGQTGTALSTMYIAIDLGIGFGALVWGNMIGWAGFQTAYLIAAGMILLAGLWHFFFVRSEM